MTEVSISGKNGAGSVVVKYLNISGRICADGWDDNDARVVCHQLGFRNGEKLNYALITIILCTCILLIGISLFAEDTML